MSNRNLRTTFTPDVKANEYRSTVLITTGTWKGAVRWNVTGELSLECTVRLIVELRKALRQVRDFQVQRVNAAVAKAEGPV